MSQHQAAYLSALSVLKREVCREQDRAQLGEPPGRDLIRAIGVVEVERARVQARERPVPGHGDGPV